MAQDTKKKFFLGAIVAGIAGYIAGILTAPKSGKQTRKGISKEAVKIKKEGEKTIKKVEKKLK